MTSQINLCNFGKDITESRDCRSPENVPADYCQKLKSGIARLQGAIQSHYEEAFPTKHEWIARAVHEAEKVAWTTPFPSLFFPVLAHLRVSELLPSA